MSHAALTHCPDCGYSLHGLPARHACPECGFEYDEHTRVWKPARPWVIYGTVLAMWGSYITMWSAPLAKFTRLDITSPVDGAAVVLGVITTILVAWRLLRARQANLRGRFIAITPRGVTARLTSGKAFIPWNDVRHVTSDAWGAILKCSGSEAKAASWRVFGTGRSDRIVKPGRESHELEMHLNEALSRYRATLDRGAEGSDVRRPAD